MNTALGDIWQPPNFRQQVASEGMASGGKHRGDGRGGG